MRSAQKNNIWKYLSMVDGLKQSSYQQLFYLFSLDV